MRKNKKSATVASVDSTYNTEASCSSATNITNCIKSFLSFPTFLGQLSGHIVLKLDSSNRLQRSPILLFSLLLNAIINVYTVVVYFSLSDNCGYFFGEYSSSDRYANILNMAAMTLGSLIFRAWSLLKRRELADFQDKLATLTSDLITDSENLYDTSLAYQPLMQSAKHFVRKSLCYFLPFALIAFSITCLGFGHFVTIYKKTSSPAHIIFSTLILITWFYCMSYPTLGMWLCCYIRWLLMGTHVLMKNSTELLILEKSSTFSKSEEHTRFQEEMLSKVRKMLQQWELLESLVERFNSLFGVPLISWVLTISTVILHQSFIILRWIHIQFVIGAVSTALMMLLYPVSIYNLCSEADKFSSEVGDLETLTFKRISEYILKKER